MHMGSMVKDKKMEALKALIQAMFEMEAKGDGDESVDPTQALHEASETPEEEAEEHAGGITEEEENAMEPEGEDLKQTMSKFMKQTRKSPAKAGRTKGIVMAVETKKPSFKFGDK